MCLKIPETKADRLSPETSELPAGVYVHIPFCQTKCPYCSFVSYPGKEEAFKSGYLEALAGQAKKITAHPWTRARKFHSLFVGGGTPSSVDPEKMAAFIAGCLKHFNFIQLEDREPEVTVEVNPNSINPELLKQFRQAGVNRLSIGMQAFSDSMLKNIGRTHTVEDNLKAFAWAREAGFTNINLDLMYGLPGQKKAIWENSLQQAVALCPEHFSVYELTVEHGTPFADLASNGKLNLPREREIIAMFEQAQEFLSAKGFIHYEISNYSRPGFACSHNINYWKNGSYIGLGASAVSCFSGVRIKNQEHPDRYIQMLNSDQEPYAEAEFLPLEARFRETVIMGLRLTEGVPVKHLLERFGLTPQKYYGKTISRLMVDKLLEEVNDRLRLTRKGLLLANRVMAHLV